MPINGIVTIAINQPIIRKAVQPVAHFIFGFSPDIEINMANMGNEKPKSIVITFMLHKGNFTLPLMLLLDKIAWNIGGINMSSKGIMATIMVYDLQLIPILTKK